jgi:processing peptidase subunit alpha
MQQLLLGGSSFSQGGPGKGMYSRLNQNVLNRNYWVDLCQSFHEVFNDSGLFGIRMAVEPGQASRAATILCGQLHALTGPMMAGITEEQLSRAKNMLKSFLVMGTEARMIAAEGE